MKIKGTPPPSGEVLNILERILLLSDQALEAVDQLKEDAIDEANKKVALKKKISLTLPKYSTAGKSQEMREAAAFHEYEKEYKEQHVAEAVKTASVEKVKTLRQVLSAFQTYVNSEASVAQMLGYGQSNQI